MPLFEFEAGRLVPAQAGHTLDEPVEPAVLDAVRGQLLELVEDPVFPVAWQEDDGASWLTAVTAAGRPVTLEVVDRLDGATLVAALARLGRTSETSWAELADMYPRGMGAFRRDWNGFRESQPPHRSTAARLHVVAATIDDDVRAAVSALTGAGVVVHELVARVMSSGRLFLDVAEVRTATPRLPWLEPGRRAAALPAAARPPQPSVEPAPEPAAAAEPATAAEPAAAAPSQPADATATTDLRAIGSSLNAAVVLVWDRQGVRHEATLTPDGRIELADDRSFGDPGQAAAALGAAGDGDAWAGWRFGEHGPSLHEARVELLAHRDRRRRGTGPGLRRRARRTREATE